MDNPHPGNASLGSQLKIVFILNLLVMLLINFAQVQAKSEKESLPSHHMLPIKLPLKG